MTHPAGRSEDQKLRTDLRDLAGLWDLRDVAIASNNLEDQVSAEIAFTIQLNALVDKIDWSLLVPHMFSLLPETKDKLGAYHPTLQTPEELRLVKTGGGAITDAAVNRTTNFMLKIRQVYATSPETYDKHRCPHITEEEEVVIGRITRDLVYHREAPKRVDTRRVLHKAGVIGLKLADYLPTISQFEAAIATKQLRRLPSIVGLLPPPKKPKRAGKQQQQIKRRIVRRLPGKDDERPKSNRTG